MWHVSIRPLRSGIHRTATLFDIAERVLVGVGDRFAGEWREQGLIAIHLRRRLTALEAARIDPVCDIRGTPEAAQRLATIQRLVGSSIQLREE